MFPKQLFDSIADVVRARRTALLNGNGGGTFNRHVAPAITNLKEALALEPDLLGRVNGSAEATSLVNAAVAITSSPSLSDEHFTTLHLAYLNLPANLVSATDRTALATVATFARTMPGAGIEGIGAKAALDAMSRHWDDHLSQGHGTEILMTDFDALILLLQERRNELANALRLPSKPDPMRQVATEMQTVLQDVSRRWDEDDQADAPELGASIDRYANFPLGSVESADVLIDTQLQRWDVSSGAEPAHADEPKYRLAISHERLTRQTYITVTPAANPEGPSELPQLMLGLEINEGLPCVHIYGDTHGDVGLSVFGKPHGRLGVRPGDASTDSEAEDFQPKIGEVILDIQRINAAPGAAVVRERK